MLSAVTDEKMAVYKPCESAAPPGPVVKVFVKSTTAVSPTT